MAPLVKVEQLKKSFGDLQILNGIDLEVDRGEVVSIIGPSGSGKTTILRCLNLLERPDGGRIEVDGQVLCEEDDKGKVRFASKRDTRKIRVELGMGADAPRRRLADRTLISRLGAEHCSLAELDRE